MPVAGKAGQLWAVIMAGGSGTRFWPESRRARPKQFLRIFGKKTLIEQTLNRLQGTVPPSRTLVITQREKQKEARRLLKKVPPSQVIGEPVGRNTAPCAILAASLIYKKDPGAVLALLPADHYIAKENIFRRLLSTAAEIAREEKYPVTFGIKPKSPHTGYGYLERDRLYARRNGCPVYRLKRFHEKPGLDKAKRFFRSGKYLWNSGIFVWRADELLNSARRYLPPAFQTIKKIEAGGFRPRDMRFYRDMPDISIDYGLMEKLQGKILAIPADIGWNDAGGWNSLADLWPEDPAGNIAIGKALLVDSERNIVKSRDRLVVLLGVKDHVVVETPDALLVCPRAKTETIRRVVAELKEKDMEAFL